MVLSDKVSVIIPAYNHERFVGEAIESVLGQDHNNLELIIVNDGSNDGTDGVILGFKDKRIKYIAQENCGAHAAINEGIKNATGEYISILNSDDVYHPQRIKKCLGEIKRDDNIGMVCGLLDIIDEKSTPVGQNDPTYQWYQGALKYFIESNDLITALISGNFIMTSSNIFCRSELAPECGFFKALRYAHDLEFIIATASRHKVRVLDEKLMKYRVHEANTIRENQYKVRLEVAWIYARYIYKSPGFDTSKGQGEIERSMRLHAVSKSAMILDCSQVLLLYRIQLERQYGADEAERVYLDIVSNEENPLRIKLLEMMIKEQ